jgi:hypothetical protein
MHGRRFLLLLAGLGLRFFLYPLGTADFANEKPLVPPLDIIKFFAATFRTIAHPYHAVKTPTHHTPLI